MWVIVTQEDKTSFTSSALQERERMGGMVEVEGRGGRIGRDKE